MPKPINISASRGAAILGLSSWKTPVQSWLEIMEAREPGFCAKRGYVMPEFEYSSAMKWGHAFESAIIELARNKYGAEIIDREKFYSKHFDRKHLTPNMDVLTCHIDGRYDGCGNTPLHEGKTTSLFYYKDNFGEPGTDKVPVEYQIQCQHQMICTGAEKVILSVLVFPRRVEEFEEMGWNVVEGEESLLLRYPQSEDENVSRPIDWSRILDELGYFHQFTITANPELQQLMLTAYAEFWEKNVLGGVEPEPKTYDDIKLLCPEPVGTVIATDVIERFAAEYKDINLEIGSGGSLAKRKEQIKVELLKYMKSAGAVKDDDSSDRWVLRGRDGKKLFGFDGKVFR